MSLNEHSPEEEFADLFRRFVPQVLRYVQRRVDEAVAWDVVNETFLVAWRRRDAVPVAADEQLPWLYAVAGNAVRNANRAGRRRFRLADRVAQLEVQRSASDPADIVVEQGQPVLVAAALGRLGPDDQEILRLVGWESLGLSETAAVLGVSYNTAKVRLHRARRRLQQALTSDAAEHADQRTARPPEPARPVIVAREN